MKPGNRTADTVSSPLLYRLSYRAISGTSETNARFAVSMRAGEPARRRFRNDRKIGAPHPVGRDFPLGAAEIRHSEARASGEQLAIPHRLQGVGEQPSASEMSRRNQFLRNQPARSPSGRCGGRDQDVAGNVVDQEHRARAAVFQKKPRLREFQREGDGALAFWRISPACR
ncbi:MAG: hypothetical protein H7A53_06520 [Akkermansiaceae bacterium]|nr:hypothetical protein [Akkermansiaceae bacterium]